MKSIYGGGQSMLPPKINLRRGLPPKMDPFSEANPLEGLSRLKGSRPINSPHQTLTIKGNLLSQLLHLLAATQLLGSLLCSRLLPIFHCTCDSFPFLLILVTPRVEQQSPLPLHASPGPASICATPLHTAKGAAAPSPLLSEPTSLRRTGGSSSTCGGGGQGGALYVLWACSMRSDVLHLVGLIRWNSMEGGHIRWMGPDLIDDSQIQWKVAIVGHVQLSPSPSLFPSASLSDFPAPLADPWATGLWIR